MPDLVIAAIVRPADEERLDETLAQCAGLETSRIALFRKATLREVPTRLRSHFIPFSGAAAASGSHGTNVPGMGTTLTLNSYAADAAAPNHLESIGISSDAAHYYNIAIDEGRSVVTYVTGAENATLVQEQFRACGFAKIRRFPWKESSGRAWNVH